MKVKIGAIPFVYPLPIALVGALVGGRPNFETVGDCGLMGIRPPLVYVSTATTHYTNQGILSNGTFSINFPSTAMLSEVDFCGQVSGRNFDKSSLFQVFYGEIPTAPLIEECPVNLECRVVKEFSIQHRQVFVGEVVEAHVDDKCVVNIDGNPRITDLRYLDPILYALNNQYYRIGEPIGVGYEEAGVLFERYGVKK